jgi:hypothetical protein
MEAIDNEYPDAETELILHIDNSPEYNSKISKNYVNDAIYTALIIQHIVLI